MRSRILVALFSGLLAAVGVAIVEAPVASAAVAGAVPRPDHVVIVVEENKAAPEIVGHPDAPYITSLAAQGANFTNYYALTHPSQPNYLGLFSGSTQGLTDDSCPNTYTAPSLGDQLIGAGFTFAGYSESLPSAGYTGCSTYPYARKHSPWVNFPAVPASANKPFSAFPTDYSTLPDVSFVIPNLQNDMHDGTVAQGDTWVQNNLGGYAEWAKTHNSLLVLTFDEDDYTAANHIATVFVGQQVVPGNYTETINHYNLLRTIEDAYGLTPLGASATAPPIVDVWTGNRPPTASFTASCPTVACSFDAGGSADADGTIASYAWDFGDGATGRGVAPSHTYAATGQYPVSLTVTDDQGASRIAQQAVVVGSVQPFVLDSFNRTVSSGFGSADIGGGWSLTGSLANFAVSPGTATITLPKAGAQLAAALTAVARTDADVTARVGVGAVPVGGSVYLTVEGRRVSAGNEYGAKVLVNADKTVTVRLIRLLGGAETAIAAAVRVPGLTYAAGLQLNVRVQVTGTSPTAVRARVWPDAGTEPAGWQVSATDASAGLQQAGATGFVVYLSSGATNAPLPVMLTRFAGQPTTTANAAPTAAFTSSCTQLTCTFDGRGSSDPDGALSSWSWVFGDGSTGTGSTVQHAYVLAGDYPVQLTVTDAGGAKATVTHVVTATTPPLNQPPVAAFTSSCTGLACSFDGTGSTDDEGVVDWAWDFGDGSTGTGSTATHTFAAGTYSVRLSVSDDAGGNDAGTHPGTVTAGSTLFAPGAFNPTGTHGVGTPRGGGA